MSNPVQFALVGAGGIAQSYAQAFEDHPDARLVAVADVRAEAAATIAGKSGVPSFGSYQALLADGPKAEAVVICTPPNTHEDITTAFAQNGSHVLCEKPFTLTAAGARRMAEAARRAGVLLTMASKFRYVGDVTAAKELITSGAIGEVVLWENAFTGRVEMGDRWNSNPAVAGGGVLIDNGTHSVDLMRYFLGPLAEVHCVEGKRIQQLPVEDTVRVFVRSAAGVMGNVDLSWSINKELDWYLNIFGSAGVVQVGWKQSRIKRGAGPWETFGAGYQKTSAFRSQLANFARAIRDAEPLVITSEDAIASVDVIEAAYRSLRAAAWTGVTPRAHEPNRTPATDRATTEAAHA